MGWVIRLNSYGNAVYHHVDDHLALRDCGHPIPDTLDSAAACLREGWCWERTSYQWKARSIQRPRGEDTVLWDVFVPDTQDELADRFALALASWEASAVKGTR